LQTLRKNNKKIMAVIGVFLMIAFVSDYKLRGRASGGRSGSDVIGKIGNDAIHSVEYENARAEWELVKRMNFAMPQQPMMIAFAARRMVAQIEATTYLLLLREARKMDIMPG